MTEIRESALITSGIITFLAKNGWAHTYFVAKLGKIEACGIVTAYDTRKMSVHAYPPADRLPSYPRPTDKPVWMGYLTWPLRQGAMIHLPDPRLNSGVTTAAFTIARLFSTKEALAGEREIKDAAANGVPTTERLVPEGWKPRGGYLRPVRVRRSSGLRST